VRLCGKLFVGIYCLTGKYFETETDLVSGITIGGKHFSRRIVTFFWVALSAALIIFLLYKEWIAVLYVLVTLALTVLLVVVAMADLSGTKKPVGGQVEAEASNER
jgi:hypothetical protein